MKLDHTKNYTIGDLYRSAMEIQTAEEAQAYFAELVRWCVAKWGKTEEESAALMKTNLGYFAGYYDHATRQRVETLFDCEHPVFGSIAKNGAPTHEEAFKKGVQIGKSL